MTTNSTARVTPAALGFVVIVVGVLVTVWIVGARFLFGVAGDLAPIYIFTLGPILAALQVSIGISLLRTARGAHQTRPATIVMAVVSWVAGILLGLTIPDVTRGGLQTILSSLTGPGDLDLVVGLSNPLGIVTVGASIAALVLASGDARGRPAAEADDGR